MSSLEEIINLPKKNGVIVLPDSSGFKEENNIYLKVRKKEGRIYSDKIVKHLPEIPFENPFYDEWKIRKISIGKLLKYISLKNKSARGGLNILDLGCGNGWMSNKLSFNNNNVFALDLNLLELEQGARVFSRDSNLHFIYGNIFEDIFPNNSFDLIIAASSLQYFNNLKSLITRLKTLIKNDGEIHLIDSPFYTKKNIQAVKKRTEIYFEKTGFPEMKNYYFHHLFDDLEEFKYKILYNPGNIILKLLKLFLHKYNSPFPWIMIKK